MRYLGGKHFGKSKIIRVIEDYRRSPVTGEYRAVYEPFMGGYNITVGLTGERHANDICPYIVACAKALSEGWIPPKFVTKEEYKHIRDNKEQYPKELVGFVGYGASFGGKFFGGYGFNQGKRDASDYPPGYVFYKDPPGYWMYPVVSCSYNSALKHSIKLKGVHFYNVNYYDMPIPDGSLVYCDPPYKDTTSYKTKFNHDDFYDWCVRLKNRGCDVLISEFFMPEDRFYRVSTMDKNYSLDKTKRTEGIYAVET